MKEAIRDIQDALKSLEVVDGSAAITDFKRQKIEAARLMLKGAVQRLKRSTVSNPEAHNIVLKMELASFSEIKVLLDRLASVVADDSFDDVSKKSRIAVPKIPSDISSEVLADIKELESCLNVGCLRSAIILCGRILETALHRKYYDATGQDLLEKAPGMGLGNLIARLNDKGVKLDPGLPNQIHLINQVRIVSVHTKKDSFIPSKAQTEAIVLYTLDVVDKLFK